MFFVFVILFTGKVFEVNHHLMNLILVYVIKDKLDIRKTLEEEARKCQWLVLWLDCDREGENIAYEVVEVCLNVNSRLNIWRARFSSLIDREIHQAAQQLVRPNQLFSEAVDVRQGCLGVAYGSFGMF
ncbi:putative DNA topoisomerase [Helianthus annuus]|nr:putative DNA topoisomerase [Helianthus annuus]